MRGRDFHALLSREYGSVCLLGYSPVVFWYIAWQHLVPFPLPCENMEVILSSPFGGSLRLPMLHSAIHVPEEHMQNLIPPLLHGPYIRSHPWYPTLPQRLWHHHWLLPWHELFMITSVQSDQSNHLGRFNETFIDGRDLHPIFQMKAKRKVQAGSILMWFVVCHRGGW